MADLSRREQMMEQRNPPVLAEQYETLDRMIAEASAMVPSYTRMSDSINNGETMYALAAAEQLRSRLLQKQRDIDSLSQSIVAEAENENCGVKEAQLRKNIRFACVQTLQSIMSSLVSLPTAQQYEKLVEVHKKEVARQIEESRMRAANEVVGVRASSSLPSVALKDRPPVNVVHERTRKQAADGWTPQQTRSFMSRWTIPDDADLDAVETNLSEFGRLVIETPKTGLHTLKREVPIRFTPKEQTTTEPSGIVVIN
ncbi:hypothetical protein TELCIR_11223 [Teladorsagia circumcincta]|uniref:SHSP domain-containing protein n=1 Tax=Teladorsagia circumcincta TaxID=45464 RepID=A0A2G9UBB8_TELCI|nr:hypothetical protein TELCIR_11223 [Teladorsagia circumcincta]